LSRRWWRRKNIKINKKINKNMKPKILSQEVVMTNTTTDASVAAIIQEVATLIYAEVTNQ
jgi:hypothetical protein